MWHPPRLGCDCLSEVSMDRIRIGYPAGYLRFFRIRIEFGYLSKKKWIRTGSGYRFDFYNEISLWMIQDVTYDGGSVFFAIIFILSVCAAFITVNANLCYFIVNFFRPSGSSELLLYCWYSALSVVLNGICVCCVG